MSVTRCPAYAGVKLPFSRVLVVDDQLLFLEAIASVLRRSGVKTVEPVVDHRHAPGRFTRVLPDLVLVNSDPHGVSLGEWMIEQRPSTRVVGMCSQDANWHIGRMKKAGFHGAWPKSASLAEFLKMLSRVGRGAMIFRPLRSVGHADPRPSDERDAKLMAEQLTSRELDVLALLVKGASSGDIARVLGISTNTVRSHVQNVLCKLQVHSRLEAATFAVRYRITGGKNGAQVLRSA